MTMPGAAGERVQRDVTRVALAAVGGRGFALAGSGAIREHGIVDRPTQDVDLFTDRLDEVSFGAAVDAVALALRGRGMRVQEVRRAPQFAQLHVLTAEGGAVEVDLGVDWRAQETVTLSVGPVLSVRDAVASKVGALYSRAEARDFVDVDAIRQSGRFTDAELLAVVMDRDPGFEVGMFATQLAAVRGIGADAVAPYGVDAAAWAGVVERLGGWSDTLRVPPAEGPAGAGMDPEIAQLIAERAEVLASFPRPLRDELRPDAPHPAPSAEGGTSPPGRQAEQGREL